MPHRGRRRDDSHQEARPGRAISSRRCAHIRTIDEEMRHLTILGKEELVHEAKNLGAPLELVAWVAANGKLPVPNFSAGGIATPADVALVMQLGAESRVRRQRDFQIRRSGGARQSGGEGGDLL